MGRVLTCTVMVVVVKCSGSTQNSGAVPRGLVSHVQHVAGVAQDVVAK